MLVYTKRCHHCNRQYQYQASGSSHIYEDMRLNDDRYCPDCMKVIITALEKVPVKFHSEYLPILPGLPYKAPTIEELDAEKQKRKDEDPYFLEFVPVTFMRGVSARDYTHKGVNYRKYYSSEHPEIASILTAEYEINNETGEVTDTW